MSRYSSGVKSPILTDQFRIIENLEPLSREWPSPLERSDKKAVFIVPRPPFKHITAPQGFDPVDHEEPVIEISYTLSDESHQEAQLDGDEEAVETANGTADPDGEPSSNLSESFELTINRSLPYL